MEKIENLYYIYELNENLNEKELRKLLLQNEVEHIQNNINDYIVDKFDLIKQCETLKNCLTLPIENIINNLETWWSYSITKLKYQYYTFTVSIKPTASVEETQEIFDTIQKNYSKDFINIVSKQWKHQKENEKTLDITFITYSSNIDSNNIENYLDSLDIVTSWK